MSFAPLVERIQLRDEAAARELVELVMRGFGGMVARTVGDTEAPDVLQTICWRAILRIDQLANPEALMGWIKRIAVNEIVMHRRRSKYRPAQLDAAYAARIPDDSPDTERRILARERLDRGLKTMNPRMRDCAMRRAMGSRVVDIATETGRRVGAVKSDLMRARGHLVA